MTDAIDFAGLAIIWLGFCILWSITISRAFEKHFRSRQPVNMIIHNSFVSSNKCTWHTNACWGTTSRHITIASFFVFLSLLYVHFTFKFMAYLMRLKLNYNQFRWRWNVWRVLCQTMCVCEFVCLCQTRFDVQAQYFIKLKFLCFSCTCNLL